MLVERPEPRDGVVEVRVDERAVDVEDGCRRHPRWPTRPPCPQNGVEQMSRVRHRAPEALACGVEGTGGCTSPAAMALALALVLVLGSARRPRRPVPAAPRAPRRDGEQAQRSSARRSAAERRARPPQPAAAAAQRRLSDAPRGATRARWPRRHFFSHDSLERGELPRPHPQHRLPARRAQLDRRREHRLRVRPALDAARDRARLDEQPRSPGEHPVAAPSTRSASASRPALPRGGRAARPTRPTSAAAASGPPPRHAAPTRPQPVPRPPRGGRTRGCPRSGRARPPRPPAGRRAMGRCPPRAPAARRRS